MLPTRAIELPVPLVALHDAVPLAVHVHVTVEKLDGTVSAIAIPVALLVPLLATVIWYCTVPPNGTPTIVELNVPLVPNRCSLAICRSALSGTKSAEQPKLGTSVPEQAPAVMSVGNTLFCGSPVAPILARLSSGLVAPAATVTLTITVTLAPAANTPAVLSQVITCNAKTHVNGVALTTELMTKPVGTTSTMRTVLIAAFEPPLLRRLRTKANASPGFLDCGSMCDLVMRTSGAICTVFKSMAQPSGLPLVVQAFTSAATGDVIMPGRTSPPPPMRERLVCCTPAAAAPTLMVKKKLELPPAGIDTADVQAISVLVTRVQLQLPPLVPGGVNGVASAPSIVMVPGNTSRKLMVPTLAAVPMLLMTKT